MWLCCSDVSSRSLCSGCFGSSRDSCGVSKLLLLLLQLLLLFLLLSSLERSVLTNKRSILLKSNYKKEKRCYLRRFRINMLLFSVKNLVYNEFSIQRFLPPLYRVVTVHKKIIFLVVMIVRQWNYCCRKILTKSIRTKHNLRVVFCSEGILELLDIIVCL